MRTEQKSRTLPGLISARGWLPLLLMTTAICFALPAALVSTAQTAEAETETAKTETTETKAPEKESTAEDAEADTSTDKQEEAPKEKSETPEESEKKQEPPADSEKKSEPKEEPASEKETSEPAKDAKDTEAKDDAKEMKSDESEKPAEEATPPAEKKVEPKPESEPKPKPDPKPDPKPEPPKPAPVTPKPPKKKKCIIGSTAVLLEKQSEIQFRARVDTGAKSCSLHVEKIKIEDESKKENVTERMTENIGKVIHFEVKNGNNKTHILTSKIAGYVIIKTSDKKEGKRRYKVPLTFRWKSMEKEILVTLNNRKHMDYPLLLGRNFLKGDFLVDVELNSDD